MKTGIFYGSTYSNTQNASEQLVNLLGDSLGEAPEAFDVYQVKVEQLLDYDLLLIGCSTWHIGELQDDWDDRLDDLGELDFSGKMVALFGAGDQIGYSDTFADGLGILAEKFIECGATLIGKWPTEGYDFGFSRAELEEGYFVGLPLDYDNQSDLTEERLKSWSEQIVSEAAVLVQA